jgi:hypothetical protein
MKTLIRTCFLSMLLAFWILPAHAQTSDQKSVGDAVYAVYKDKGIDKALSEYQSMKKKKAADYEFDEHQLNRIGYKIMNDDNDAAAAKKILWLNMQEYPNAINPKDSYADVLVRLGEKEEARQYYQAAIDSYQKQGKYERNVSRNSTAKLAVLNNKHQAFNFLAGDWAVNSIWWNDKNEEFKDSGEMSYTYANDMVLVAEMKPQSMAKNEIRGQVWVITYNAQEDRFETAWVEPNLRGLLLSTMKLESQEGNKHIYLEEFKEDGDQFVLRHEIVPEGNSIQWVMYESKNGQDFRKMLQADMTRHELSKK